MKTTLQFLLIHILVLVSCQKQPIETTLPYINLSDLQLLDQKLTLSNFSSDISYHPLETSDSSLISEIHDAYFTDSTIAVFEYFQLKDKMKKRMRAAIQFLSTK